MKLVKTLAAAAVLAMSSFATQASPITVGGVTWDPEAPAFMGLDFTADTAQSFFQVFNSSTNALTGYGRIASVQGNQNYCLGCELLFKFTATANSVVNNGNPTTSELPNNKIFAGENRTEFDTYKFTFDPTTVNIFVATSGTFNNTLASVGGASWLNLTLSDLEAWSVFKDADTAKSLPIYGASSGKLTAINDNALASYNFYNAAGNGNGTVDATFGARQSAATANLIIATDTISSPSSLAALGLGLIGLAGVARRKVKSN